MPDSFKGPSTLPPEVYHTLIEVRQQRSDIQNLLTEVHNFRLDAHGRITKLETKAGILGFIGGLAGGALLTAAAKFISDMFMG